MIKPAYLLEDVLRALRKLGLDTSLAGEEGLWTIRASSGDRRVRASLASHRAVVPGLETLGAIPITRLSVEAEGPPEFIEALKYRLRVELLRCLG
ncbi:hypothetical protein DRO33_06105 [Candidatus Bathyarchaeota archaeon]|nr:MAG: hypothetical protein DRO33_06105 [Candidatus Bathyarchaeota archaeon]